MLNRARLTDICLSLVTGPVVVGLCTAQCVARMSQDLGIASEELFRGNRLPALIASRLDPWAANTAQSSENAVTPYN